MATKKRTTTGPTRLDDALEHGDAHHERSPWRIRKGKCQVGRPVLDSEGNPKKKAGKAVLTWHNISKAQARKDWMPSGWILE